MKNCIIPIVLIGLTSCAFQKPLDVIITENPFILNAETITINCDPPLARTRRDGSILISIKEDWTPEPPWKKIQLKDGPLVSLNVTLLDESGKTYKPVILGAANSAISARFEPQIPKESKIVSIQLSSSGNLTIEKIIWHNFNPL